MTERPPETSPQRTAPTQALLALAGFALAGFTLASSPSAAHAQTRTPTSPLDSAALPATDPPRTAPAMDSPGGTPTGTPAAGDDTGARSQVPLTAVLPSQVAPAAPLDIAELIPPAMRTGEGLTPQAAIERAQALSLPARMAEARTQASEAALQGARRAFVPRTTVAARYTRLSSYAPGTIQSFDTPGCLADVVACQAAPEDYLSDVVLQEPILNQYALTASVAVPLSDYLGANRHELAAAELESEAARLAERGAQEDAILQALEAYFELVRARAQLRLAESFVALAEERSEEARTRVESGLATRSAMLDAEAYAQSLVRLQMVAETRVTVAERSLRDLLALPEERPLVLSIEVTQLPAADARAADDLRTLAQEQDPYARAAGLRAEAMRERAEAERARMLPSLSLALNYTYANPNQRIFPQTTEFRGTWDLSAQLSFSLDGALLAGARRSQRNALALESSLAAEGDSQRAGRAAVQAQGALTASLAEVDARRIAAASASQRQEDAAQRAEVGLGTATDLQDANTQALRARLDLVDAVVDAHLAHARLARALGGAATP